MAAVARGGAFFCACMYVVFCALSFYYGLIEYRGGAVVLGMMVFCVMLVLSQFQGGLSFFSIAGLWICFFAFSLFNYAWSEYRSVFTAFVFGASFGIAWYAIEFQKTKYLFEVPFKIFLMFTIYLFIFEGYGPSEFNKLLFESSRNVYSGILLALASGYIFSRDYRGKTVSLALLFLVCLASIPLYSRNGIFISVVLFFCALWQRSVAVGVFVVVLGFVGVAFGWDYIYELLLSNTNLSAGVESDRYYIAMDYFNCLDLFSFFVGVDLSSVPMVEEFGGNPHSAFLRLHSFFGVSVFFLIIASIVSFLILLVEKKLLLALVLLLYLFRAVFDIFYLFNLFDYLVFPLVFYWYFRRFRRSTENRC